MAKIANHAARGKNNTRQAKTRMCIVLGCQRLRRATWEDATAIARNGSGYMRAGRDLIWFWSEAFEQGALQ